ncbi:MAG: hypothetical protein IAE66_02555 [Xanthomonadaceae bacterium]|nr:hypothetical protein [Xanthomonadaceae bacterium]
MNMHHRNTGRLRRSVLPFAIAAACLVCLPGASQAQSLGRPDFPTSKEVDPSILNKGAPDISIVRLCRPFRYSGTVQFPRNFSGMTGEYAVPTDGILRIDKVSARLHQPGLRDADLGGWTLGIFGWYDMVREGDQATYSSARDGAVYLDSGSLGKVTIYRRNANAQGSGEFSVSGCLVDAIPPQLRKPDHIDDRLPPKHLDPGGALKAEQAPSPVIRVKPRR